MKIIILAAGRGSRLGEKTRDKPKCMVTLCGKTIIERAVETIEQAGFLRSDIIIVTGYKKELIDISGVSYIENPEWESTNMFVSLTKAGQLLQGEPCVVCYSDIVFSKNALMTLAACNKDIALTYYTKYWELWEKRFENPLEDLETLKLGKNGCITEIGKRANGKEEIEGQYMGLILFTPASWAQVQETIKHPLPKTIDKLDMTTLLNAMVEDGQSIYAIKTDDMWLECDTENDIEVYEREFSDLL